MVRRGDLPCFLLAAGCADFRQEKGPGDYPSPCVWWWNREPNPRPHMRFVSKALFLRVPARTKWPFCFVKNLGWVGVGLR